MFLFKGEECDSGLTSSDRDPCCTKNCRLTAGSQCNDRNSACCRNCKFSRIGQICLNSNELDCKRESYCTGLSADCPKPEAVQDGTKCSEDGLCLNGECKSFCEQHNSLPCMCADKVNACRKCCKESLNSTCYPFPFKDNSNPFHKNGSICLYGYCSFGRCVNSSQDYVERFWSIIDDIEYNSFTMFLKDNLVCCVIFASFFVFIPAWYFVEKYDQKMKEKLQRLDEKSKMRAFELARNQQNSFYNQSGLSRNHRKIPPNRREFSSVPRKKTRRVFDESNSSHNYNPSLILSPNQQQMH